MISRTRATACAYPAVWVSMGKRDPGAAVLAGASAQEGAGLSRTADRAGPGATSGGGDTIHG
jgi:hypothetical protein